MSAVFPMPEAPDTSDSVGTPDRTCSKALVQGVEMAVTPHERLRLGSRAIARSRQRGTALRGRLKALQTFVLQRTFGGVTVQTGTRRAEFVT